MKPLTFLLAGILISINGILSGQVKKMRTEHFRITYEQEAEKYAEASTRILETVYGIAMQAGYDMPGTLKFTLKKTGRNLLYYDHKRLSGITWEYKSPDNLLPPRQSRKRMCMACATKWDT